MTKPWPESTVSCVCGHNHTYYFCTHSAVVLTPYRHIETCRCRVFRSMDGKTVQDVSGKRAVAIGATLWPEGGVARG